MRKVNMVMTFDIDVEDDSPEGLNDIQRQDYLVDKAAQLIGEGYGEMMEVSINNIPEEEE